MELQALSPVTLTGAGADLRGQVCTVEIFVMVVEEVREGRDKVQYFTPAQLRDRDSCPLWWDGDSTTWYRQDYCHEHCTICDTQPCFLDTVSQRYDALLSQVGTVVGEKECDDNSGYLKKFYWSIVISTRDESLMSW